MKNRGQRVEIEIKIEIEIAERRDRVTKARNEMRH